MSFDQDLAERLRECLAVETGLSERRMFGGLAFLINGNMAVAASGQGGLMLRVDPEQNEELVSRPHARPFVMQDREIAGWLRIDDEGVQTDQDLERWVALGTAYARALPPK